MKTAVLMATYNGKKYLKGQLDSIRQQTQAPETLIIRDDGSTDGTPSYLREYVAQHGLSGWQLRQNETNLGWRLNFRQLLLDGCASGADLLFLSDQDDLWAADKIKIQTAIFEQHPEINLLSSDYEVEKLSKNTRVQRFYPFDGAKGTLSQYPAKNLYQAYRPGWTYAIRTTFLAEFLDLWKPDYNITHDCLLTAAASLSATGYHLNQSLGTFRRHEGNATNQLRLTIHSSEAVNLDILQAFVGFYEILYHFLRQRQSPWTAEMRGYYDFYQRRYQIAQSGKALPALRQLVTDWRYYTMSGRARDLLFLFKR